MSAFRGGDKAAIVDDAVPYRGTLRALTPTAAGDTTAPLTPPSVSGVLRRTGSGTAAGSATIAAGGARGSVAAAFEIPSDGEDSSISDDSSRVISAADAHSAFGMASGPPPRAVLPPSSLSISSSVYGSDASCGVASSPLVVSSSTANSTAVLPHLTAGAATAASFAALTTAPYGRGSGVTLSKPPVHAFHSSAPLYAGQRAPDAGSTPFFAAPGTPPASASTAVVAESGRHNSVNSYGGSGGIRSSGGIVPLEVAVGQGSSRGAAMTTTTFAQQYLPLVPMTASPNVAPAPSFLVLGTPHCGISTFINAYRASVAHSDEWPSAPTGICGLHGTTAVDAYPNLASRPSWYLLDTPGIVLDDLEVDDGRGTLWLQYLFDGIPMKTKLVGPGSCSLSELSQLAGACTAHRPRQCIVVVSAIELIHDVGARRSWFEWISRYIPGPNAGRVIRYLQLLISRIRLFLDDLVPFVVVTHMDQFGGTENCKAREVLIRCLTQCISQERVFFLGCPPSSTIGLHLSGSKKYHDVDGAREMRKLHRELMQSVKMRQA